MSLTISSVATVWPTTSVVLRVLFRLYHHHWIPFRVSSLNAFCAIFFSFPIPSGCHLHPCSNGYSTMSTCNMYGRFVLVIPSQAVSLRHPNRNIQIRVSSAISLSITRQSASPLNHLPPPSTIHHSSSHNPPVFDCPSLAWVNSYQKWNNYRLSKTSSTLLSRTT